MCKAHLNRQLFTMEGDKCPFNLNFINFAISIVLAYMGYWMEQQIIMEIIKNPTYRILKNVGQNNK